MAQVPPPGGTGAPVRPPLVTAAAIVLFVVGGLQILFGLFAFGGAGVVAGSGFGGALVIIGIIAILIGAASIYAGVQVMALKEQGRMIGLVISGIGALLALIGLVTGNFGQILGLLAYGFVIYALVTTSEAFRRV
jgi:hypothetical protein